MRDSQEVSGSTVKGPFSVPEYVLEMKAEIATLKTTNHDLRLEIQDIKASTHEEFRDIRKCFRAFAIGAVTLGGPVVLGLLAYLLDHFFTSLRGI